MDMPTDRPIEELAFEDALKRLEEIVHTLETGEAKLGDAITLYEEGTRLRQQCSARLDAAQARIEAIRLGSDGRPAGVAPFDGG
ncbi:MAG: exodeoxyribonuclease small subunit [Sphingomonas bacterium]|nr:exodeoxyribonuclease small subunit [Sphingomonas bacterium]